MNFFFLKAERTKNEAQLVSHFYCYAKCHYADCRVNILNYSICNKISTDFSILGAKILFIMTFIIMAFRITIIMALNAKYAEC